MKVIIKQGDITRVKIGAIVNAANVGMLGGGGVDGAIHRAAGPRLKGACALYPEVQPGIRCPIGEARLTEGFNLPADYVIHTVGPMWSDSVRCRAPFYPGEFHQEGEPRDLLASCVRSSLKIAQESKIQTIAFPAISCRVFGGRVLVFTKVAHEVIHESDWAGIKGVAFVLYKPEDLEEFKLTWEALS